MWDVVLDALKDALIMLAFLFVLYIVIELLEHKTAVGKPARALSGKCAPLIGGAAGLLPLCGFSVMAGKLYQRKYITVGTLLAVFIATSDEALLVLAFSSLGALEKTFSILALLGSKFVLAVGVGYLADLLLRRFFAAKPCEELPKPPEHEPEHEHEHEHEHGHEHEHSDVEEFSVCEHKHESKWMLFLVSPLLHALQVAAVIFLFDLAFGTMFYFIGTERVIGFLQGAGYWFQPLICPLVGMIPNCASSVALAQTFALHGIGFGGLLGGLVTNVGLGVLILFRDTKAWKRNLLILLTMFLLGVAFGYAASGIEILFI